MTDDGRTEHGDVIMTEDGFIFVAYRRRMNSTNNLTGLAITDGDMSVESPVDLCVDYTHMTAFEGPDRSRIESILSAERDRLSQYVTDKVWRDVLPAGETEAYRHDLDSLDDAARIIIGRFGY